MTISAVLLAGGKSSRMGQDKATMLCRGARLWTVQLDLLRQLHPAGIFVSAQIDPAWRPPEVDFVPDDQPSRGPLSGIAATLSRIATDHLLVLGIDMPFMTEIYLRNLCAKSALGEALFQLLNRRLNRSPQFILLVRRQTFPPRFRAPTSHCNHSFEN